MVAIIEDYVSSDIAKLLREKGFDWDDSPFSSEQEKDEWIQNNSYSIHNPNTKLVYSLLQDLKKLKENTL